MALCVDFIPCSGTSSDRRCSGGSASSTEASWGLGRNGTQVLDSSFPPAREGDTDI